MSVKARFNSYEMSRQQRKAMNDEITRQLLIADEKYALNVDAMILYTLHKHLGFGKKRLKRFFDAFREVHDDLLRYYEMDNADNAWLCLTLLKRIGVDVEEWEREVEKKNDT